VYDACFIMYASICTYYVLLNSANKCTFCWRHHKNPVGKEWRWVTDDPLMIVDEAVKRHQAMINEMKGMSSYDQ
jgi:wyosine [tRNA(Phe)-imidazoG37] synthetase (radical SAM superfamily)